MKKQKINPLSHEMLSSIGLAWSKDADGSDYVDDEIVVVSSSEAEAFYEAGNAIYDMYIKAAEYVIEKNMLHEIGIPFNLVELVKESWSNDVHWHLYGRFDLAGGVDGLPIKLLEFNADTPTSLYETAVINWALLKSNNLDEDAQFNTLYDALRDNFKRLITLNDDIALFEEYYEGWKILFSSTKNNTEEEATVRYLMDCAIDAGFECEFCYLDEVVFDENEGIFDSDGNNYEYWFKLFPWEDIAFEGDLPLILTKIVKNQKAIILNPAYTLIFQSKALLKIIYDLFPNSPYLLKADTKILKDVKQVEKRFFGREGDNTKIIASDGKIEASKDGDYDKYGAVYQEYATLARDEKGSYYQAGLFFAYESCALGFRKGTSAIIDNMAKFVAHKIG